MKLSLSKRFGWIHCRGGKLVRVAKEHAVPSSGRSRVGHVEGATDLGGKPIPQESPQKDQKWVTAKENDLAVEVVAVKTGKVLGHSYLSGPAIQLNRYTPAQDDWFRPVTGRLIEIPDPHTWEGGREAFFEHCIGLLMQVRYGEDAVGGFEYQAQDDEDARGAAHSIAQMWSYEPVEDKDRQRPEAHLFALIHGKKPFLITLHFQPPDHASDFAATGFQIKLVLSALKQGAST